MRHSNQLLLILIPILHHIFLSTRLAQPDFFCEQCRQPSYSKAYNNYTSKSAFANSLENLLSSITTYTNIDYGFYNFSVGQGFNGVNGIALCRGDITTTQCHSCLENAALKIRELCPNQREAIGWYDQCMLQYSNRGIFGFVEMEPYFNQTSIPSVTDGAKFNQTLEGLLEKLQNETAAGNTRLKFATGEAIVSDTHTIDALMQCTPDLEEFDCYNCLTGSIQYLQECCSLKDGARAVFPSCSTRYESYSFFNPNNSQGERRKIKIIIGSVVAIAVVFAVVVSLSCLRLRREKGAKKVKGEVENEIKSIESFQMDIRTVRDGTGNFSEANKIGNNGFGDIYKAKLPNGQEIAVKRLSKDCTHSEQQFKNEVLLVAKLQHRNLVRLLGFCSDGTERLLIYEYLPNLSLDRLLFDPAKCGCLEWEKRYNIIIGIARGLLYLHEDSQLQVIHRDLNATNTLLDEELRPKISNFGMARQFQMDQTHGDTTKIAGTYGYMPPEYVMHGKFSIKSDIFSFGVLVLEIISGRKISTFYSRENGESLLGMAWRNWNEGTLTDLVDPLMSVFCTSEIVRCIHIGLLCAQENASYRPIMSSVLLMLGSSSITLPMPSRPTFLWKSGLDHTRTTSHQHSNEANKHNYEADIEDVNDCSISELDPRKSGLDHTRTPSHWHSNDAN